MKLDFLLSSNNIDTTLHTNLTTKVGKVIFLSFNDSPTFSIRIEKNV